MEPLNHLDSDKNNDKVIKPETGEVSGSQSKLVSQVVDPLGNTARSCATDQVSGSQSKVVDEIPGSLGITARSCATDQVSGSQSKVVDEVPGSLGNLARSCATDQVSGSKSKVTDVKPGSPFYMRDCSATDQAFDSEGKLGNDYVEPGSPGNMDEAYATDHLDSPGNMSESSAPGGYAPRNVSSESSAAAGSKRKVDAAGNMSESSAARRSKRKVDAPGNMSESSAARRSKRKVDGSESSAKGQAFVSQINFSDEELDSTGSMGELYSKGQTVRSQRNFDDGETDSPEIMGEYSETDVLVPSIRSHVSTSSAEYDVVFRYREGDIRNGFNCHLRAALSKRGVSVNEDIDEVSTQVQTVDAAPECRVLIVFFTSRYVPSNLPTILEHHRRKDVVVFPIFDGVSPSCLINNNESFALKGEPKSWQDALKEISQMHGYILIDNSESELIDEIVGDVSKALCSTEKKHIIGIDRQVDEILSLMCIESPDVRSIGIWGPVGIGKTTVAKEICRRISSQYETCIFLADLHDNVELNGHDAVSEELLTKGLGVDPHVLRISDIKESFLRSRLQRKKVLIVLDDVNSFRDVETYLGRLKYFGSGSRIIVTSRNRRVFVQTKVDHVYEVKPLDISNSLSLLRFGVLQSVFSQEAYMPRLLELVKFAHGNPKVLQFFGRERSSRSVGIWDWLSQQQVQQASPTFIPHIFERSCCGLDDSERSIFLDIACFFRRMDKDDVATLLDGSGFSAHVGFGSLVDKSLLIISHNMLDMLSFIQATGREIVRQESADRPGDRSRLWSTEDIMDVLLDDTGTSAIEGMFLDMSTLRLGANPNVFEKMCNLRLLKFYCSEVRKNRGVSLTQGLEYLPSKLRLLHWEYYPLSYLPPSFDPKNLVELNLPNSSAKKLWKGKKGLEKLKKMRLRYSYQLTQIPRLSRAPNLELLDLEGCESLVSISHSICYLKKLVFLNLKDCSNLESVPSTAELESLEVLNLSGCLKLENFPEISPNVKELYLGGTMIQEIPSSIKNLVLLQKLDLENSRHLVNLPTSICKLKHLETLNLSGCSSLERFPDLSKKMKCLKSLDLSRTAIKELPASISYLTALEELRFVGCKSLVKLPDNAWSLRFKVEFRQIDTEKFSKLWNRFGWLKKVQIS